MLLQKAYRPELIHEYLDTIIQRDALGEIFFNPWLILQNTNLAKRLIREICNSFDFNNSTGICILANSGIPLGVLLALSTNKPMYFYRRDPWEIEDLQGSCYIYPQPPKFSHLTLIDSHIGSGFTSGTCYDYLLQKHIAVDNIVAPISFINQVPSDIEKITRDTNYCCLSEANDVEEILLNIFQYQNMADVIRSIKHRKEDVIPASGVDPSTMQLSKFEKILTLFKAITGKREKIEYLDLDFCKYLRKKYSSHESDMWLLLTSTNEFTRIIEIINQKINFNNYDMLIGTGILGTIFSLCFYWFTDFQGAIYSTYKPTGWDKLSVNSKKTSCLVFSGRVRTGVFLKSILKRLHESNIEIEKVIVIRYAPQGVRFPKNLFMNNLLRILNGRIYFLS